MKKLIFRSASRRRKDLLEEALKKVKLQYQEEHIVLDASDLIETDILPVLD